MGVYLGLDVSLKQPGVCVIDEAGKVVWRLRAWPCLRCSPRDPGHPDGVLPGRHHGHAVPAFRHRLIALSAGRGGARYDVTDAPERLLSSLDKAVRARDEHTNQS